MRLTFSRNGKEFTTRVRPQSAGTLRNELYDQWIKGNRDHVDSISKNRIAYSCMKNMGSGERERFLLDMVEQEASREAIILALRSKTGGNVQHALLRFLSHRQYLPRQNRGGKPAPQSNTDQQ